MEHSPPPSTEPAAPSKAFPGILQSIFLLLLAGGVGTVVGVVHLFLTAGSDPDAQTDMAAWTLVVVNTSAFVSVCLLGWMITKARFSDVFPLGAFDTRLIPPILLLTPALLVVLGLLMRLFLLLPLSDPVVGWMDDFVEMVMELFLQQPGVMFLAVVIVAPVTEELFFRGLLLRGFLARYSTSKALAASTVLFTIAHLSPAQLITTLVLGVYLGWLYIRTRNLWPCILAHAANNALAFFATLAASDAPDLAISESTSFGPWWVDAVGLLVAVLAFRWLLGVLPPREPESSPQDPTVSVY